MSRSLPAGRHTDVWRLAVGAVLVAIALGVHSGTPAPSSAATPSSRPAACPAINVPTPDATERGWNRHIDPSAGFSIDYPPDWTQYQPSDSGVAFLAGPNGCDSVEVRVISNLNVTFDPNNTQAMKAVSDALLAQEPVQVGAVNPVAVSGLKGWEYIYTFHDAADSATGAHVHIFLFQGNRVFTLVFQTIPADDLRKFAATFDEVVNHFTVTALPAASPGASPAASPRASPAAASATPSPSP